MTSNAVSCQHSGRGDAGRNVVCAGQLSAGTAFFRPIAWGTEGAEPRSAECAKTSVLAVHMPPRTVVANWLDEEIRRALLGARTVFPQLPLEEQERFIEGLTAELSQAEELGTAEFLDDYLESWEETVELFGDPRYAEGLRKVTEARANANKGLTVDWDSVIDAIRG